MLSYARRAFNFEPEREIFLTIAADNRTHTISKLTFAASSPSTGLRLVLDQTADSTLKPNFAKLVLQKPSNTFNSVDRPSSPVEKDSCFLTTCQLCKKPLKSGEDIYMYMGDQGFCSVECRSRQIAIDERKEVEEALDRRLMATGSDDSDLSQCPNGGECQTCRLLKDLRRRRRSSGRRDRG